MIRIGRYDFEGPFSFNQVNPKEKQGIYAILTPTNQNSFNVTYMGQTSDFSSRGLDETHHAYTCWITKAGSKQNLFISFLDLTGYSEQQRLFVEEELIKQFNPACNVAGKK